MKKIILILLVALPVFIVFFTALGASFIIAELKTFPIERIEVDYTGLKTNSTSKDIYIERLQSLDFSQYVKVYPEKAKFSSLKFVSSDTDVISVENGVMTANQYLRNNSSVLLELKSEDGLETFVALHIYVEEPQNVSIVDYIGFDLSKFTKHNEYGKYCTTEDGKLIIDKSILENQNARENFNVFIGFVVAPYSARDEIVQTLTISGDILVSNGEYTHEITGEGEASATLNYGGKSATLQIIVR